MPESLPGRKNGVCDNDLDFRNYGTALIPNRAINRCGCGLTISVMRNCDKPQQRRAAKAVFDQAKFQYSQSALRAFQEVSDALTASQKLSDIEEQQKHEVRALTESVAIANRRYRGGLASYYEVLEAQQLLYPAEFVLSQTSRDRRLVVVQLYKALGGSWSLDDTQFANGH